MDNIEYSGVGELYISDIESIWTGTTDHADHVVTVCQSSVKDNIPSDQPYSYYCMSDGPHDSRGESTYELFERAATDVWNSLRDGNTVILHCHMGQSRSVAIGVAALGRLLDIPRHESFGLIKDSRSQAHPDQLLMGHAATYIEQYSSSTLPFTQKS